MADEHPPTDDARPTDAATDAVTGADLAGGTPAAGETPAAGGTPAASEATAATDATSRPWWKRRPHPGRHPVLLAVMTSLVLVAGLTATGVTLAFNHFDNQAAADVINPTIYGHRPHKAYVDAPHQPLNILVMGSDTRDCDGCAIDKETGGGSDTTILIHLSGDRKHAYGVSVPRDTMVDRAACKGDDGVLHEKADYVQWNAAYSIGGPGCTITQFEHVTHLRVDDFIVVNFAGFKDMVDAVGGVEVCIPQEIDDRQHGIVLQAGTRTISGNESLSYVRERHGVGDGSDLGRIKRQQAFIASMVKAVLSAGTLSNPVKVFKFLNAALGSLEVDSGLGSIKQLASLGYGFRDIGLDNIKFFTAPIATDPQDLNRVVLTPEATQVWKRLRKDLPIPADLTTGAIKVGQVPGQDKGKKHKKKNDAKVDAENAALAQAGLCTI